MTIKIKAIEQHIFAVLFILLYKVALTFESVYEILNCDHLNELKASKQYFPPDFRVVLLIMLSIMLCIYLNRHI